MAPPGLRDGGLLACALAPPGGPYPLRDSRLTNLTRDHLDFHGDMNRYFDAKRQLFDMLPAGRPSIINLDDPRGATLADLVERPVTYAVRPKPT